MKSQENKYNAWRIKKSSGTTMISGVCINFSVCLMKTKLMQQVGFLNEKLLPFSD